jgi:serine/threonine-protein kinase
MTGATRTCPKCSAVYGAEVIFCRNDGTILDDSAGTLTGQIIAERYRIISRIGEGGMGKVYLAEHIHMKRRCAIKFLHADLAGNEGALKRFYREAENASRIDHPNVVTVYDFGEAANGGIYLAMEYVEGESLQKKIERGDALPRDLVASIVRQTASALQSAHAMGIAHRDLKPDNIMLVARDGETRVKVVDFGIAKARGAAQKVTVTGAIVGTPDYMSPEQLLAGDVDGRTDQYALALVAVKMLTGKLPFAATTSVESITSRLTTEPMPLRSLRADVAWPQLLQDVIARALAAEPADRYPTVIEFSRAFDRAIGTLGGGVTPTVAEMPLPASAIPPTRVSTPPPRSRFPLAVVVVAMLLVGGSAGAWFAHQSRQRAASPTALSESAVASRDSTMLQQAGAQSSTPLPVNVSKATEPELLSKENIRTVPPPDPPIARDVSAAAGTEDTLRRVSPPSVSAGARQAPPPVADSAPDQAPAETTPPAPLEKKPDSASVLAAEQVQALYTAIRAVVQPEAPVAELQAASGQINILLPRVGARLDSVRLLSVRAQAEAFQGDLKSACATLSSAIGLARDTRLEGALRGASERLSCP